MSPSHPTSYYAHLGFALVSELGDPRYPFLLHSNLLEEGSCGSHPLVLLFIKVTSIQKTFLTNDCLGL